MEFYWKPATWRQVIWRSAIIIVIVAACFEVVSVLVALCFLWHEKGGREIFFPLLKAANAGWLQWCEKEPLRATVYFLMLPMVVFVFQKGLPWLHRHDRLWIDHGGIRFEGHRFSWTSWQLKWQEIQQPVLAFLLVPFKSMAGTIYFRFKGGKQVFTVSFFGMWQPVEMMDMQGRDSEKESFLLQELQRYLGAEGVKETYFVSPFLQWNSNRTMQDQRRSATPNNDIGKQAAWGCVFSALLFAFGISLWSIFLQGVQLVYFPWPLVVVLGFTLMAIAVLVLRRLQSRWSVCLFIGVLWAASVVNAVFWGMGAQAARNGVAERHTFVLKRDSRSGAGDRQMWIAAKSNEHPELRLVLLTRDAEYMEMPSEAQRIFTIQRGLLGTRVHIPEASGDRLP